MSGTTQQYQYRPMKVTNLKQLALEFIVIFLGVSASFGVTSFSQMRFEKTEENRLLEALTTEIETIREYEARVSRDVSDDITIYSECIRVRPIALLDYVQAVICSKRLDIRSK